MPSRVIINSVKGTPGERFGADLHPDTRDELDSFFIRFACRHMWTISDATSTAAVSARTPSHSA